MKKLAALAAAVFVVGLVTPAAAGQNDGPGPVINPPGPACSRPATQNPQNPNGPPRNSSLLEERYLACGPPFGFRAGIDRLLLYMYPGILEGRDDLSRCNTYYGQYTRAVPPATRGLCRNVVVLP